MDGASGLQLPATGLTAAGHHNGRARAVELTPAHVDLANWLLTQETSAPGDLAAVTVAAERVLQKVLRRLAKLITPVGCQALLSRALHLARADYAFLQDLQVGPTNEGLLEALRTSVAAVEPGQARDGLACLIGTLIGLVVVFIGEDLTMRLLVDLWSGFPVPVNVAKSPIPSAR